MNVEEWSRSTRAVTFALVAAASACAAPGAGRPLGLETMSVRGVIATTGAGDASHPVLTVTSDDRSATVDAFDDDQVEASVRTIVGSRVAGIAIDRLNGDAQLHIDARVNDDRRDRPLYVIDGVPLAADYGLKIPSSSVARIQLLTESLATRAYGPRAKGGVVLVTLRAH